MIRFILFFSCLLILSCSGQNESSNAAERKIITAGGTITEIVYELGFGESIIATDITSTYPETMQSLPSIGYRNQIKAEGILSLGPDLILAEEGYLSPDVVTQLQSTAIELWIFEKPTDLEGTYRIISELSDYLEVKEKGEQLLAQVKADEKKLNEYIKQYQDSPSVAFVMARGKEMVFVAGEDTFAESLITMSGLTHTGTGFKDFIPLTPEALTSLNPDFLLFFDSGLASIGGKEGVASINGITNTKAFRQGNILAFDGLYLSGFGPRVAKAALELAQSVRK